MLDGTASIALERCIHLFSVGNVKSNANMCSTVKHVGEVQSTFSDEIKGLPWLHLHIHTPIFKKANMQRQIQSKLQCMLHSSLNRKN